MNRFLRSLAWAILGTGVLALQCPESRAQTPATPAAADCEALVERTLDGIPDAPSKITSATYAPAAPLDPADSALFPRVGQAMGTPAQRPEALQAHCRVSGYVAPHVQFQLLLPAKETWNGRFMLAACDGFCGQMKPQYCLPSLALDFATATTDGGHTGVPGFDAVWAYGNQQAIVDFGYRANHVVALAAKAIIALYYGRGPEYSYMTGCSKGGSAGVMAAIRYPRDFDGIIAGSPVLDYQGKVAIQFPWIARAVTDAHDRPVLEAAKVPAIQHAAMEACDALDGARDGLISDPRLCRFDPARLACSAGRDDVSCLTPAEIGAVRAIYAAPTDSKGKVIYPAGTIPGSEGAWPGWLVPKGGDVRTLTYMGAEQYLRYMAFSPSPGPRYDFRDFDFDTDPARLATQSPILDATSPDLREFEANGGRLLIWHGWADAAISPLMTIRYYDDLAAFMGSLERTQRFARLMLLPGVFHCSGTATGPTFFDPLSALRQWREQGRAPDVMPFGQDLDGDGIADRTRPVFPYPTRTVYKGKGDVNDPASFRAEGPSARARSPRG